jgi:hypothetical protein
VDEVKWRVEVVDKGMFCIQPMRSRRSTSVVVADGELTLLQGKDMDFDNEFLFAST